MYCREEPQNQTSKTLPVKRVGGDSAPPNLSAHEYMNIKGKSKWKNNTAQAHDLYC